MSIIRERILKSAIGQGISGITISLGSGIGFLGYQQEIDNLTKITSADLVNPVVDIETRKYKLFQPTTFKFGFGITAAPSFTAATFTQNEISGSSSNMLNSFFILDFYNTYNTYNQTKIFTTYLTKIGKVPTYSLTLNDIASNQLYYWYVPISYINVQTGTTATGYVKLSFYNAKTGNVQLFYNQDNFDYETPEKMFWKSELNVVNKTWKIFINGSFVDARELTLSPVYTTKVGNTYDKYYKTKQVYPSGSTYYYKTNKYITTTDGTVT